jgi:hypothetical protein
MRVFTEHIATINDNQQVKSDCGDFTIINTGTSGVIVNGILLAANDQYICYANEGETNRTIYNVQFDNTAINKITVIRKVFS